MGVGAYSGFLSKGQRAKFVDTFRDKEIDSEVLDLTLWLLVAIQDILTVDDGITRIDDEIDVLVTSLFIASTRLDNLISKFKDEIRRYSPNQDQPSDWM